MTSTPQRYSSRVGEALTLATRLHNGQLRKGTTIPYVSHLVAVAALVIEDEGSEEAVIAALLHDAVEDQGGAATAELISRRFGDDVAAIVIACSDAAPAAGTEKAPWRERKLHHLATMPGMSDAAILVTAADKLHNAQATLFDVGIEGSSVWDRFKTGREGFLWYHGEVLEVLQERIPYSRSVRRLGVTLELLQMSAERPPSHP